MNKTELIKAAAAKAQLPQSEIAQALAAIVDSINESLERKESVVLIGFGSFSIKSRRARTGYNPSTGKNIEIPAKDVVVFRTSGKVKK